MLAEINNCTICQDLIQPTAWWKSWTQSTKDKVHTLACGHQFHVPCLQEHVNEDIMEGRVKEGEGKCPNCRDVKDLAQSSFSSSSKKIRDMLKTAFKVGAFVAMAFGLLFSAIIINSLGFEPTPIAMGVVGLSGFLATQIFNKLLRIKSVQSFFKNLCLKILNWKTGLELKSKDLNYFEIAPKKKVLKWHWITYWKRTIFDWKNRGFPVDYDLKAGITREKLKLKLNQAYDDPTKGPDFWATYRNNACAFKSEKFNNAMTATGLIQLVKFGVLIPKQHA